MDTKVLLSAIIGFMAGGLLVSIAATTFEKPEATTANDHTSMVEIEDALKDKNGDEFDKEFINQMIIHHEGAIAMAALADENAKHNEIKDLSDDIITTQTQEIEQLKKWQDDWKYTHESDKSESHN